MQTHDLRQSGRKALLFTASWCDCDVRNNTQTMLQLCIAMIIIHIFWIVLYVCWRQWKTFFSLNSFSYIPNPIPVAVCLTEPLSGRLLMAMTAERLKALWQCERVPWPVASSCLPSSALPSLLFHQGLIVVALCALAPLHSGRPLIHIHALHRPAAVQKAWLSLPGKKQGPSDQTEIHSEEQKKDYDSAYEHALLISAVLYNN